MSEPAVFQENYTSAAVDGARIAAMTATLLVEMDSTLSEEHAAKIRVCLQEASAWLNEARTSFPATETTSVHIVQPGAGGIIVP